MRRKVKHWSAPCMWQGRIRARNKRIAYANYLIRKNRPILIPPPPLCSGCHKSHETTWCPRCDKFEAWCEREGHNSHTIVLCVVFGLGILILLAMMFLVSRAH